MLTQEYSFWLYEGHVACRLLTPTCIMDSFEDLPGCCMHKRVVVGHTQNGQGGPSLWYEYSILLVIA